MELAQVLRRSENEFVGVGSGLLDQFSSLFGRDGCALFLDCRTLEFERLPLGEPGPAIVVCDSKTSRRLADGMYDQRRTECERVVAAFQGRFPGEDDLLLSQLSLGQLESRWDEPRPDRAQAGPPRPDRKRKSPARRRCASSQATSRRFGALMSASHASSRDDFENSSEALDTLIEVAADRPRVSGRKALRRRLGRLHRQPGPGRVCRRFLAGGRRGLPERTGITPEIHICHADRGRVRSQIARAG